MQELASLYLYQPNPHVPGHVKTLFFTGKQSLKAYLMYRVQVVVVLPLLYYTRIHPPPVVLVGYNLSPRVRSRDRGNIEILWKGSPPGGPNSQKGHLYKADSPELLIFRPRAKFQGCL